MNFDLMEEQLSQFKGGTVTLSKNEDLGLAIITLDHMEKKNAISGVMMVELRKCILELEKWPTGKAVLVRGHKGWFSSGGDLTIAKSPQGKQTGPIMCEWMQDALQRLQNLPLFSVALIDGVALGGGAEIAVACDFILVSANAKMGFVQGRMGITTVWGGASRLLQRVNRSDALDLLLSSRVIDAEECHRIRFANEIVSDATAFEDALKWIERRMQCHHSVSRGYKTLSNCARGHADYLLHLEKQCLIQTWGEPPNQEALAKHINHLKLK